MFAKDLVMSGTKEKLPKQKIHLAAIYRNRHVPLCAPDANFTISENKDKVECRICLDKAKFYE